MELGILGNLFSVLGREAGRFYDEVGELEAVLH